MNQPTSPAETVSSERFVRRFVCRGYLCISAQGAFEEYGGPHKHDEHCKVVEVQVRECDIEPAPNAEICHADPTSGVTMKKTANGSALASADGSTSA